MADVFGNPDDQIPIGQRRLYCVADGRTALAIGQGKPIRSVEGQFIEAMLQFEEELCE